MNIVVIGATSAIAQEMINIFLGRKDKVLIVGRNPEKIGNLKAHFETLHGGEVKSQVIEVGEVSDRMNDLNDFEQLLGGSIDKVVIAYGSLTDQERCARDFDYLVSEFNINFTSLVGWMHSFSNYFIDKKAGQISVIGSVAGDRGRKANYIYGTAKGALERYTQGLRNTLHNDGVDVLFIKPGFVDTPMTASMKKSFLFASPQSVSKSIVKAMDKKQDILYVPGFWRFIMFIITSIPEKIFKRLSI